MNNRHTPLKRGSVIFWCVTALTVSVLLCGCLFACQETVPDDESKTDTQAADTPSTPSTSADADPDSSVITDVPDTPTEPVEPDTGSDAGTDADTETETEYVTEGQTEIETIKAYTGAYAEDITLARDLANGVTGYYEDTYRKAYVIENQNATLIYQMSSAGNRKTRIRSLTTPDGHPYLTDTGDTFVRLKDGSIFYASSSIARANLYDQGYYYYDVHILDQTFTDVGDITASTDISVGSFTNVNMVTSPAKSRDGTYSYKISDPADPYVCWTNLSYSTGEYNMLKITLSSSSASNAEIFFIAGGNKGFSAEQRLPFSILNDGEFHTYYVPLDRGVNYTGTLTGLRLDLGKDKSEVIGIADMALVKTNASTPEITIDRNFITYSDKMQDIVRFMTDKEVKDCDAIGSEFRIAASTVDALLVKDKKGTHSSLDGVDWASAEYIGFDIKEAGIFGIIPVRHETSGQLSCSLEGDEYVIRQTYVPAGNKLTRGQEVYVGRRLYTDASHSFDDFVTVAEWERNPLENLKVTNPNKTTYYAGYDPLRGVYELVMDPAGNFSYLYQHPEKEFSATFDVTGNDDGRPIYIFAHTTCGCLECAAVLDKSLTLLPIQVEVCKNFAHDGEELYYTQDDSIQYGYAIFPVLATKESKTFTVLHLYEAWGLYRLKQISSIRFHQAYYHMSTGVTETNCISFYHYGNRLPDHRAMSQPYWGDTYLYTLDSKGNQVNRTVYGEQPQHCNNGTHEFLKYVDADGLQVTTESVRHTITNSGPTYYDLTMYFVSTDNKMDASIRHVEMPQYDENRNYTQINYTVKEPVTVGNFKYDFEIYSVSTNQMWDYVHVGYLDADNQSKIASSKSKRFEYVLGSEYPYFDYFGKTDSNPNTFDSSDCFSNLSILIRDYDIVIGGETYTGPLVIIERNHRAVLTLDIGAVTLLPGDHIRMNFILMPWGDQSSEDDENVRLVRENTLLHPIVATSDTDAVSDDIWVPTIISKDRKQAIFTISGGCDNTERTGYASEGQTKYTVSYDRDYNITVKVGGFSRCGTLFVYEQINGEWVSLTICSEKEYDGYSVVYEADNTFSYSFVINMNDAQPRTFRCVVN